MQYMHGYLEYTQVDMDRDMTVISFEWFLAILCGDCDRASYLPR